MPGGYRGFKIWYNDASGTPVYKGSTLQSWKDAPSRDILHVLIYEDYDSVNQIQYRHILDGADWYWWDADPTGRGKARPVRDERVPKSDGNLLPPPEDVKTELLKSGVQVSDKEFKRKDREVMNTRDF